MPTVPKGSSGFQPRVVDAPSETDMMMALAVMKQNGILSKLDPNLQGRIDDRRGEPPSGAADADLPDIAQDLRAQAANRTKRSVRRRDNVMSAFEDMKARRGN